MLIIDGRCHAKQRCFENTRKAVTRVSLVAFYGRKNTRITKLDTYLNSAKAKDSCYGILFAQKRSLLKTVNFSSSFLCEIIALSRWEMTENNPNNPRNTFTKKFYK